MGANTPSNETGPHELALLVDVECEFDAKTRRTLVALRASIRNLRHVAPVTREGSTGKASMSIMAKPGTPGAHLIPIVRVAALYR